MARIAACVLAACASVMVTAESQTRNRVVAVYREIPQPLDACGYGTGPNEVLRADTPPAVADDIRRKIDAARVPAMAEEALARVARALPGATVTVCIYAGELSRGLPYMKGVGGVSLGGGNIKLFVHPGPDPTLARVPYTVAHEYHHEAEQLLGPPRGGPLAIMVSEGKADYFARTLYPAIRPGHTLPLSDQELANAWQRLVDYGRTPSPMFRTDFMIDARGPTMWPGYRLGFEMVETFFRERRMSPAESIKVGPEEILDHFVQTPRGRRASGA
jgi:Predicted Zn-dependent protease (DUF2268)